MFGMPAKYIFHSIIVGVEYYNYLFDSGHQESSQSFTMNNHVHRALLENTYKE